MIKKINIYKGNIYRILVEDVKVNKGSLIPTTVTSELIDENVEFYLAGKYFVTVNGDHMQVDKIEAEDYMNNSLATHRKKIIDIVSSDEISDKDKRKRIGNLTSCPYVVPSDMKLDHSVTKSEFKELRKKYKEQKKKN